MVVEFSEECKRQVYDLVRSYTDAPELSGTIRWDLYAGGRTKGITDMCRRVATSFRDNTNETPQEAVIRFFISSDNPAGSFISDREAFTKVLVNFGLNVPEINAIELDVREKFIPVKDHSLEKVFQPGKKLLL